MKVKANRISVFLVGASGSGKSIIGQRLATQHEWILVDTDTMILASTEKNRISDIFMSGGESYFRKLESDCIGSICDDEAPQRKLIVATGGGLSAIPGMMKHLNNNGITIYLKASLNTLWKRLSTDPKQLDDRPLLKENGKSVLGKLLAEREKYYYQSTLTIDTDQLNVDEVCELLAAQIELIADIALNK